MKERGDETKDDDANQCIKFGDGTEGVGRRRGATTTTTTTTMIAIEWDKVDNSSGITKHHEPP